MDHISVPWRPPPPRPWPGSLACWSSVFPRRRISQRVALLLRPGMTCTGSCFFLPVSCVCVSVCVPACLALAWLRACARSCICVLSSIAFEEKVNVHGSSEEKTLLANSWALVATDIAVAVPAGHYGRVGWGLIALCPLFILPHVCPCPSGE